MPGKVRRLKSGRYRGKWGGRVVAKSTSKRKASSQQRLLRAKEHGWKPK